MKNKMSKLKSIIIILLLKHFIKSINSFNVNFNYKNDLNEEPFSGNLHKRQLKEIFLPMDEDPQVFTGFKKLDSLAISFPLDTCIIHTDSGQKYAAVLHHNEKGSRQFTVHKILNATLDHIASYPQPNAMSLDCVEFNGKGYVSIALANSTQHNQETEATSIIYELSGDVIKLIQFLHSKNEKRNILHVSNNEFFLFQIPGNEAKCPYFKWSMDANFKPLGNIPCGHNTIQLKPFTINEEAFIAVPVDGSEYSEILKYSQTLQKFELFQKLQTSKAIDVEYFELSGNQRDKKHFLVFAFSGKNNSIIYAFNSRNEFVPYQELQLSRVKKIQALQFHKSCILVASCAEDDIYVYQFENGKFKDHPQMHFTGLNFHLYLENNVPYLLITHQYRMEDQAVLYAAVFKDNTKLRSLEREIIEWLEHESGKFQSNEIEELATKVQNKRRILETYDAKIKRDIAVSNINTVSTESLLYPKRKMSENYWKSLWYINQGLELLENELAQKHPTKRHIDMGGYHEANLEDSEYDYDTLNIGELTINQKLEAKMVNGIRSENPVFKEIHADKITIFENFLKPDVKERTSSGADQNYMEDNEVLMIRNLNINGKLNEYTWNDLLNDSLKREAEEQFINAPTIKIKNLETPRLAVTSNVVNQQHLSNLIPIDAGEFTINQDIQFAQPIKAKAVQINERLNNVPVLQGKLDVLLRRSNETQVIEGPKSMRNVKVMEPITIAGQMLGKHLESITPNKAIHQPLILHGDFMINGDVDILQSLKTGDIIDLREKMSVKQTLDNGIRMNNRMEDVKLKFLHPIKANNTLVSFVNRNDLQKLVKLNQDEIQIVEGEKHFTGSLEISRGFSEFKNLNGIDVEKLEKNAFLRNNNQTIAVPMKLGKISANSINSPSILINNHNISDYLTKSTNQTINGNLIVDNLKVQTLKVDNLNTNNRIFQQDIVDIYRQKSRSAPTQQEVFTKNQKFHGSIYVKNLILNSTINERNIEEIERNLLQLEGNIKYVGNFKFNYPMNVTTLTFYGKLNDIKAEEFGKTWLQKYAKQQVFLVPQTLGSVEAENGIHVQGNINGYTINDLYTKTYWINRDEFLNEMVFENPIDISSGLTTQTLNHHYVPEEFMCHNEIQHVLHPLTIEGDLEVLEEPLNVTIIKNIHVQALRNYLQNDYNQQLIVENAYLKQGPPVYRTLNKHNIAKTLDTVWLANENVVLPQNVEIDNAYFEGLLEFEGPMNNMDLTFVKENYFSKTKMQNVASQVVLAETATFAGDLHVNNVQLFGPIIDKKSGTPLDFMKFVENTLKTTTHHPPPTIMGNWSILEAVIDGNLNQVLVNNLNLVDDVVPKTHNVQPYVIRAPKMFLKGASIENLLPDSTSVVNKIPIGKWINEAVYLYENYTIYGTTTLTSLNVFNDLQVMGKLNNITFNEDTLLLQDRKQILPKNLRIMSHLKDEKRFLTNNIDNLFVDFINSEYMPRFVENLIPWSKDMEIKSHVVFKEPINVDKYYGPDYTTLQTQSSTTPTRWYRSLNDDIEVTTEPNNVEENLKNFQRFQMIENYLQNITKVTNYALDHFEIVQTLDTPSSKVMNFHFNDSSNVVDVLALLDDSLQRINFYKWHSASKQFIESLDFEWLPQNPVLLNIIQKMTTHASDPIQTAKLKELVANIKTNIANTNVEIEFWNETCLFMYPTAHNSPVFKISCVDFNKNMMSSEIMAKTSNNIRQILNIGQNSIALITNTSLEIWSMEYGKMKLSQKLLVNHPKQLSLGKFQGIRCLAIVANATPTSLNNGFIEIYRSINGGIFKLWQTLSSAHAIKVEFSYITTSHDFLLYAITDSLEKSFIVYQYQGNILGFQEHLTDTILPKYAKDIKLLDLKSTTDNLLSILYKDKLVIIKTVLSQM
ncbi:closca [Musca autumnalis]|uniref:closca n=1 Tax=Musca autumnalis TaxID=221902 RepID=UPI003CF9F87D